MHRRPPDFSTISEHDSSFMHQIIFIHPDSPPKPGWGQPCNGCGICCAAEPCPIGIIVSGRRVGACSALQWNPLESRYRCGVLAKSAALTAPNWLTGVATRLASRLIAAGTGCDCALEPDASKPPAQN